MNIPDGEYDIDLLVLKDNVPENPSLAIRYGFIPDSMDQASPVTLFQNDDICILEAHLVDKVKQSGLLPIIFEGVPQRQRPIQHGLALVSDSYYLSFLPADKKLRDSFSVLLRNLDSTVRVNKSRNAEKWRTLIKLWRNGSTKPSSKPGALVVEAREPARQRSAHALSPLVQKRPGKPPRNSARAKMLTNSSNESAATLSDAQRTINGASKRPPARGAEARNDIISVSDFEDLSSEEEGAFPIFDASDVDQGRGRGSKDVVSKQGSSLHNTDKRVDVEDVEGNGESKFQGPKRGKSTNAEMDDDFADLEDQLDEVLDTKQTQRSFVSSESDDDSDGGPFASAPIVIDVAEDKKPAKRPKVQNLSSSSKPISLRDMHGGGKNDYLSSSEEE